MYLSKHSRTCYRLTIQYLLRRKNCHSQENIYLRQKVEIYSPNCINIHILQRKVIIQILF